MNVFKDNISFEYDFRILLKLKAFRDYVILKGN